MTGGGEMNEILKKRIEEAAAKYSGNQIGLDYIGEAACEQAFIDGAEYALSHQFISVEEAFPEANENVLALIGGVPVVAKGYHVRARIRGISHWMPIPKFEPNKTE